MEKIKYKLGLWFICPYCEKSNYGPLVSPKSEYEKPYGCQCGERFSYVELAFKHDSLMQMNEEKICHCQIWTCSCGHESYIRNPVVYSKSSKLEELTKVKSELLSHQYALCEKCGNEFELRKLDMNF